MSDITNSDINALIAFINETLNMLNKTTSSDNKNINTVSTLFIILFALIFAQKLFKYIIKPLYYRRQQEEELAHQDRVNPANQPINCVVI